MVPFAGLSHQQRSAENCRLDRVVRILHQPITASLLAVVGHGRLGRDLTARVPIPELEGVEVVAAGDGPEERVAVMRRA
jgi:hypothetical protein